jgi:hypothetical protein
VVDPIRDRSSLQPPAPVGRVGAGRGEEPAVQSPRAGHGRSEPERSPERTEASHARRGTAPHRAADDLAQAAAALDTTGADDGPELAQLRARLQELGFDPAGGAEALRRLAGQGAVPLRVALLASAAELRPPQLGPALEALVQALLRALPAAGGSTEAQLAAAREALATVLQRLGAQALPPAADPHQGVGRELLNQLAARFLTDVGAQLGERAASAGHGALLARLARADRGALAQRLGGPVLAVLLALPAESALRASLVARALDAVHPSTRDTRLALLADVALDPTRSAERALASLVGALESEASTNAVRREIGEPTAWTLPVFDGQRWSTVTLLEDRHGRDARDSARKGGDSGTRVTLGTEFSALGPVRADLAVSDERVVLRFVVADPETAQRLRQALGDLRERLAAGDREVVVALAEGRAEDARVDLPPLAMDHLDLRG